MKPAPLLALLILAGAAPAAAEPQILPRNAEGAADMQAYARTEAYRKLLVQAMARIPAAIVPRCPKLVVEDGAIILQQKLQFAPDKSLVGGSWRTAQPTRGCGTDVLVNFFFYGTPDRRVLTVAGLPGTTGTDLNQQRIAHTFVLMALNPMAPGCGHFQTVNTSFVGFGTKVPPTEDPGAGAEFRPWSESWTVLGCGKRYSVPMNFIPNRMGLQVQPGTIEAR